MGKIYIPAKNPDDWQQFLADPEKHWRTGYSARTLAHSWHANDGFPPEIEAVFADSRLGGLQPLLIIPEHITPIAGLGQPPHNDIFVLGKATDDDLIAITIEGKVNEPFGQALGKWKSAGNHDNRRVRLDFLLAQLGLDDDPDDETAYQLIQRTAAAVVEAKTYNAPYAVMLVHSFSPTHKNFEQFQQFVSIFGHTVEMGDLIHLTTVDDIQVFVGWVNGDPQFLSA